MSINFKAIGFGALTLAVLTLPAAAQNYRNDNDRYTQRYSSNDMDRYGQDEYDRGYQMGRGNDRSHDRYGHNGYDRSSNAMSDYGEGYRRGRDDERRYGGNYRNDNDQND